MDILTISGFVFTWGRDSDLRSVQESEELLVNVAAAFNNLSFYLTEGCALRHSQLTIAKSKTERRKCRSWKKNQCVISVSFPTSFSLCLCTSPQWCWNWCSAQVWRPCSKPHECMEIYPSSRRYETLLCKTKVIGHILNISTWDRQLHLLQVSLCLSVIRTLTC